MTSLGHYFAGDKILGDGQSIAPDEALRRLAGDRLVDDGQAHAQAQTEAVLAFMATHAPPEVARPWREAKRCVARLKPRARPAPASKPTRTPAPRASRARRAARSRRAPQRAAGAQAPPGGGDDGDPDPDGDIPVIIVQEGIASSGEWAGWALVRLAALQLPAEQRRRLLRIEIHGREAHVVAEGGWSLLVRSHIHQYDIDEMEIRPLREPSPMSAQDRARSIAIGSGVRDCGEMQIAAWVADVLTSDEPVSFDAFTYRPKKVA